VRRSILGLAVALLLLAACGGGDQADDGLPPDEWVARLCAEVGDATGDLESALAVIDQLPTELDADAPLGDRLDALQRAFASLPTYVERYLTVVEDSPPPATADGAAFRDELLVGLREATREFDRAAEVVALLGPDTTVTEFFAFAQTFTGFTEALAAADLDFGDDAPPGVAEARADDASCRAVSNRLAAALG
jgi:hypothetical protein